jgi:hypothetical protein
LQDVFTEDSFKFIRPGCACNLGNHRSFVWIGHFPCIEQWSCSLLCQRVCTAIPEEAPGWCTFCIKMESGVLDQVAKGLRTPQARLIEIHSAQLNSECVGGSMACFWHMARRTRLPF